MIEVHGYYLPDNEQHMQRYLAPGRPYQSSTAAMFAMSAQCYDLAVDVGAHVGMYSIVLSDYFTRVVAFEPIASNVECLRLNAPRAEVEQYALGAEACEVQLAPVGDNTGATYVADSGTPAQCRTLDSYELAPDAIKIDVEGWELNVLKGAEQTIRKHWPVLCIECKGGPARYGLKQTASVDYARSLGYELAMQVGGDWILKRRWKRH